MKDHTYHLYKKVNIGQPIYKDGKVIGRKKFYVFQCQKLNCNHYLIPSLLVNKIAECPRCHDNFVLDKNSKNLTSPHCKDCTNTKKKIMKSTLNFIEELVEEINDEE